ncbi:GTP-binding protein [Flavobacteriaceae bacterium S0825]|uniref:GTP-binding protein n=1 Tax=Gaetbulibacter sp. S0825 TaxID=2720084 RepID=UPI0014309566|nr:GTP-binding protein [Gaetbulibacter sp. S0825]MCK0108708.1 GTP-binding protein [Flavobacteriaceae bacterium S0825]NIX64344.1 GTP-binding protein [Gaetbulibacter sp. S0825]
MSLENDIVLRPRFKIELKKNNQEILSVFEEAKKTQKDFIVSRVDDHVFIKIPKADQHFWSPQLHLEIMEIDKNSSRLFGLFGPNPTVWTMFMFFHFIVAGLFIGFGIWAYTNWTLKTDFAIQLFVAILMIVLWVALYLGGRLGKATGRDQMVLLHNFMNSLLYSK